MNRIVKFIQEYFGFSYVNSDTLEKDTWHIKPCFFSEKCEKFYTIHYNGMLLHKHKDSYDVNYVYSLRDKVSIGKGVISVRMCEVRAEIAAYKKQQEEIEIKAFKRAEWNRKRSAFCNSNWYKVK